MRLQRFEEKNEAIREKFHALRKHSSAKLTPRLNLSWSNWGFGRESLADSARRLQQAELSFIELHGNHYGPDLGYKVKETLKILGDHGLKVSGVCGMFSADNDLSSNRALSRQAAVDYLRREIPFTQAVGGTYLLVVPGAVGRPKAYDDVEFERSAETFALVPTFSRSISARPPLSPSVPPKSVCVHTVADAKPTSRRSIIPASPTSTATSITCSPRSPTSAKLFSRPGAAAAQSPLR